MHHYLWQLQQLRAAEQMKGESVPGKQGGRKIFGKVVDISQKTE